MAFFEREFPTALSFGAQGGVGFSTIVNQGLSGQEQRNRNWALGLGKWQIETYCKPKAYWDSLYAFWLVVGGRADGFRFKDHKDFQARDQTLGIGDGVETVFQLTKSYDLACLSYVRTVTKPITSAVTDFEGAPLDDTVVIYLDCAEIIDPGTYEVDETTGLVTFDTPPDDGVLLGVDFDFHYPVRFDMDDFAPLVEESDVPGGRAHMTWPSIRLMEIR